jgi:hypothetical protein
MPDAQGSSLERWLKIVGAVLTFVGILAGLYQFSRTQAINAAKPFLEKKLEWCEEAVDAAAGIAVYGRDSVTAADKTGVSPRRIDKFWALYWGVMGMVENENVKNAMVAFGDGLNGLEKPNETDRTRALAIAHACRAEMGRDWSPIWAR